MNKYIAIAAILCVSLTAGCKRNTPKDKDTAAPAESATEEKKTTEVEMLLPAQRHVGLVVAPAAVTQLSEYFRATGTVQPIDNRMSEVAPLTQGRIVSVRVKVGDRVRAGQTLAIVDNPEASDLFAQEQSSRAELNKMNAQLVPATRQTQRSQRLADIGAGAEKDAQFSKAEEEGIRANIQSQEAVVRGIQQRLRSQGVSSGSGNSLSTLRAPFAGVVTKAQISLGDVIAPGKDSITVADLSRVWVQAEVYEKDLGRIRLGQNAAIRVDTYPDETFSGRVAYISDALDPQTRTARVRCEVANKDMRLKTDMFANIELPTRFSKSALAVPLSAIQDVESKNVIFVQVGPTKFESREVEKGVTVNGMTEIIHGLSPGEQVVTQGAFHLKSILASGELGEN
jgi:cobalt-zinc-cadmium efflux system membrane fusion protein